MKIVELFKLVIVNTMQNKFKVLLTSLGIIVGTATIVLVIAIGEGAKKDAAAQYSGLSADTIYINPDYSKFSNGLDASKMDKLDLVLMNNIKDENRYIQSICLRGEASSEMRGGKNKDYVSVSGVTEGFEDVFSVNIHDGMLFSSAEHEKTEKTAVLGYTIAEKFFGSADDAVGRRIKLGEHSFTVVGVLQRNADGLQGVNHDNTVYIPFETMKSIKLLQDYSLPQITAKIDKLDNVKKSMSMTSGTMRYYMKNSDNYIVEDAGSRIDSATKSARTMSMLLTSVALIVLTVGGIGIMNVLFVTVKERTKEIGVLKALGSTSKYILLQFLTEAVFIGVIGGAIGLLVSVVGLYIMPYTGMTVAPSVYSFALAMLFAVLTSAVFGFYPAYQASRLKPVDALSYE